MQQGNIKKKFLPTISQKQNNSFLENDDKNMIINTWNNVNTNLFPPISKVMNMN